MLILIAESKTMVDKAFPVMPEFYSHHEPAGNSTADEVMASVARMPVPEIAESLKISMRFASRVKEMAYEFPNKLLGCPAVEAYTGVVFKNLSYSTLPEAAVERALSSVRIISSLYGWLKPDDIVKPYRFDYTTRMAHGNEAFANFWRRDVTVRVVNFLKNSGESYILNLLPADAAKAVDWKLVKNFAKVRKVDFKDIVDGTTLRTPHAGRLKALRGHLLRDILIKGISNPEELLEFATDELIPLGTPDYPDHIAFASTPL